MNFIEALKKMRDGKKVRLPHWVTYYYVEKQGYRYMVFDGKREIIWDFSENEMLSDDWEIYKEEPKLHTFEEALIALKNGKKIKRQLSISEYHLDKVSSRILEIYDVEVHNGVFSEEVLANDWIILDK
jgi:hypothetical protein